MYAICTSLPLTFFFFIYMIFLLHQFSSFLSCAYITRGIPKIKINGKIISILAHQGDLLLANVFPYMLKTVMVSAIWKNYINSITYLDILISNDRLWCNSVHAFKSFIEKSNKCIPLLICEQCTTEQNRLPMMIHSSEWSKGQVQVLSPVCCDKNCHIRKT